MESSVRRPFLALFAPLLLLALASAFAASCSNDAPPTGAALTNRDSMAIMTTRGVSKLVSDSGVVRYRIIAEEWSYFDRTQPPRQEFLKGIFLERLDNRFQVDLFITADTAFCFNQNLWELRGRVFVNNMQTGMKVTTEWLFWDMGEHRFWSTVPTHLSTPERDVRGDRFEANESMTHYVIQQSAGFAPMPSGTTSSPTPTQEEQPAEGDTVAPDAHERPMPRRRGSGEGM